MNSWKKQNNNHLEKNVFLAVKTGRSLLGKYINIYNYLPSSFSLHIWSYLCTIWIKHWWFIFMFMILNYIIERFSLSKLHMYRISESEENNSEYIDLTAQNIQSCTLHHCFCIKQTINHTDELVYQVKNTGMPWKHSRLTFHMSSVWWQTAVSTTKGLRIVVVVLSSSSCHPHGSSYSPNNESLFITAHRTALPSVLLWMNMVSSIRRGTPTCTNSLLYIVAIQVCYRVVWIHRNTSKHCE